MRIKQVVEHVVVGALVVVGAVGIWGTVGSAFAQVHPITSDNNAAVDVKQGQAELPILFNVDLRAIIMAVQGKPDDEGFTAGLLDTFSNDGKFALENSGHSGDNAIIGNVGHLFVETNYSAWDILVKRDNGGFLYREVDASTPGAVAVGGTPDSSSCSNNGPFQSIVCTENPLPLKGGYYGIPLTYVKNVGDSPVPCSLQIAVGVVDTGVLRNTTTLMDNIYKKNLATKCSLATLLQFNNSSGYASFADALDSMFYNRAMNASWDLSQIDSTVGGYFVPGFSKEANAQPYFPQITGGQELNLDVEIGDPYTKKPPVGQRDQSIVFYINARLAVDKDGGEKLAGNRNGTYKETIRFTFFGLY